MSDDRVRGPYAGLVEESGLADSHRMIVGAISPGSLVLDVGCATGYLARELTAKGCRVIGAEYDAAAAEAAREHCEAVICADLDDPLAREEVAAAVPPEGVDAIACGDVLEHLRDPATVLTWLRTLLAPGGIAVISLPNIGHWTARRQFLRGRFPTEEHGLFDRTHLRFFTVESARALATGAGFEIVAEQHPGAPLPLESRAPSLGRLRGTALRRAPGLFALQVVLTLRPR